MDAVNHKPARARSRANQRLRTRKDLLRAAARLLAAGRTPTLEEVAAEALVSRATAYRYFPGIEALLLEAALDVAIPTSEELFPEGQDGAFSDPVARIQRVDDVFHEMILANEPSLRLFLANSLRQSVSEAAPDTPLRQNRRTPLIEAALEPVRARMDPARYRLLTRALALVIGTEAMIVCKDVLQLDDDEARAVKRFVIGTLVEGAIACVAGSRA